MDAIRKSDSRVIAQNQACRGNEPGRALVFEQNSDAPLLPADEVISSSGSEVVATMPSILKLPPKKWGIPMPSLKLLTYLAAFQFASSACNIFSASSGSGEVQKGLSPSQLEDIKKTLQPGDIILSRTPTNQLYYALQKAAFGSEYSHAAMYAGDNKIVDAYEKVKASTVEDFCASQGAVLIMRPGYKSEESRQKALDYLDKQLGKPYDWQFNLEDDNAHYCTEIILRALEKSNPELEVSGRWFMRKPIVVPDDFLNTPAFTHVKKFTAE